MKKAISLFCAFILLSGCELVFDVIVGSPTLNAMRGYRENNVIKNINAECLRREGVECLILNGAGDGIVALRDSLFIANMRRVVRFDLKNQKVMIIAGSNDWKFIHNPKDGAGRKAEFGKFNGIALIKNKLYLKERRNPSLRMLNIASGQVTTDKRIAPEKIPHSMKNIASDRDSLYFIDNANKRIVEVDISFGKITHIPVSKRDIPIHIDSLTKVGDFIYFTAYESGACQFIRLNLRNMKTNFILKHYKIKILFADTARTKVVPEKGESLIIVAMETDESLHFRIFDKNRKMILDKSEKELRNRTVEIGNLKQRLVETNSEYAENMDAELINSVKLITGFPQDDRPVMPEQCLSSAHRRMNGLLRTFSYIANDAKNIYFNDECLNIRRFNIKTGKLDLLARKPKYVNSINGITTLGKYLYILDSFAYANKTLIRRVNLKSGQTSYLAGVLEN